MVPSTLSGWTLPVVWDLLDKSYQENDRFDWKVALPHSKNEENKEHARRTCAGFANSLRGGFLVYGVEDDATLPPDKRLVGIEAAAEFARDFGAFPASCHPSVPWTLGEPIRLDSGKVLHVVQIEPSWKAPHAVGQPEKGFAFPVRTSKGNEFMNYAEVQKVFLGFYEKRIQLHLLRAELDRIRDDAQEMIKSRNAEAWADFIPISIESQVLESVLTNTYSVTAAIPDFAKTVMDVRGHLRRVNAKMEILRGELLNGLHALVLG